MSTTFSSFDDLANHLRLPAAGIHVREEPDNLCEPLLQDDYPIHAGYLYVVDDRPFRSPITGTVAQLRKLLAENGHEYGATCEIRRCDISGRDLWALAL
jgi:hypothetical protein